jgi:hypothetical protein
MYPSLVGWSCGSCTYSRADNRSSSASSSSSMTASSMLIADHKSNNVHDVVFNLKTVVSGESNSDLVDVEFQYLMAMYHQVIKFMTSTVAPSRYHRDVMAAEDINSNAMSLSSVLGENHWCVQEYKYQCVGQLFATLSASTQGNSRHGTATYDANNMWTTIFHAFKFSLDYFSWLKRCVCVDLIGSSGVLLYVTAALRTITEMREHSERSAL